MSEDRRLTRRDMVVAGAAAMVVSGSGLSAEAAQHVHHAAAEAKAQTAAGAGGPSYKPAAFTDHEFATVRKLADLIVPPDERSPGGAEAGAPEFIDLLAAHNAEIAAIFTGGILWLDAQSQKRGGAVFIEAPPAGQTALLEAISYGRNSTPELAPGIRFFDWARRMVVDAWATSPAGIKDLGFKGNVGQATFQVPKEALEYVARRSPV
jgi:hypothetical protein